MRIMIFLKKSFEEFGNPFSDNSRDLISVDTSMFGGSEQVEYRYSIESIGKQ